MSSYVISYFRLPKSITMKLTSAVTQFWLSFNGQQKSLHWLAWKKDVRGKSEGRLGCRTIEDFSIVLLAKQLWWLMDNPYSLFAKIFKGRYFQKIGPLDQIRSYSPSFEWRSIISAILLVKKNN